MLILRYEPVDLFKAVHTLPELKDCTDLTMDPLLSALDQVLDDDQLVLLAWNDFVIRRPHCLETGRYSTPVEVSIRLQGVRRLYGWAYRQVRAQVRGSLTLRQFTRIYAHSVPSHTTMNDWELALRPATVRLINQRTVKLAEQHGVTQGKRLRSDGTVVETNIHYPTDSSLLDDSVRVVGRMLRAARQLLCHVPISPRIYL